MVLNLLTRYRFLVVAVFLFGHFALAVADDELIYPEIGILSSNEINHVKAWGKTLLSDDWIELVNQYDNYCKTYIETISLSELMSLLVFTEKDLIVMVPEARHKYGPDSAYFESCNYLHLGSSFIQTLFHLSEGKWKGWTSPELFHWGDSDAYIDTEHSLLLIKFLDKDEGIPFDQRQVSALFIRKDFQSASNREVNGGLLKKILGSKGFSQLFD